MVARLMTTRDTMVDRLMRAVEDQSKASALIAQLHADANVKLELIRSAASLQTGLMERLLSRFERMDQDRDSAVNEVKQHVTTSLDEREQWWRKVIVVLGIALVLSNLLGVAASRLLDLIKGGG